MVVSVVSSARTVPPAVRPWICELMKRSSTVASSVLIVVSTPERAKSMVAKPPPAGSPVAVYVPPESVPAERLVTVALLVKR
jgi:hypothetical protein